MGRRSTAQKVLFSLTALRVLLTVVALVLFALAGSAFVPDLPRYVAGFALGMTTVVLLTGSPQRGRRVAALLLLASVVGPLALAFEETMLPPTAGEVRKGRGFIVGLLSSIAVASVWRLPGVIHLGPRGDQASRRRS